MKKMIAPIIITVILLVVLLSYGVIWFVVPIAVILKIIIGIILLGLCGVSIFVLIERIKEIRSGEEDDLSKY